jgi:hypothetical protein
VDRNKDTGGSGTIRLNLRAAVSVSPMCSR